MVHTVDGIKLLRDGYCMLMKDDSHWRRSVRMLQNEEGVEWVLTSGCMSIAFRVDSKTVLSAQTIKLSKIANIFTANVGRKATSIDTMRSLLSYTQVIEENYIVRFFIEHILDIAEDIMFSNFLAVNSKATYARNIRDRKIMMKNKGVPTFSGELKKEA